MASNLATTLKRRRRGRPMDRYDRLPPELRRWLAFAALPWSPQSILRLWARLLRETRGDVVAALDRLDLAEQRMLARDRPGIWGEDHPSGVVLKPPYPASGKTRIRTSGSTAMASTVCTAVIPAIRGALPPNCRARI